jgi:prophage regulatory protein
MATEGSSSDNRLQVILRLPEVARRLGISKSTVWARLKPGTSRHDPKFPKRIPLHDNPSGKGAVGISENELNSYIETCKTRR